MNSKKKRTQRIRKIEVENESATRNQRKQQTHPLNGYQRITSQTNRLKGGVKYCKPIHIAEMLAVFVWRAIERVRATKATEQIGGAVVGFWSMVLQ